MRGSLGSCRCRSRAMMRAIELNNVAVPMNKLAFSVGRLAAADPAALESLWQARHAAQRSSARR